MSQIAESVEIGSTVLFFDALTAFAIAVLIIGLWDVMVRHRSSLPSVPLFFLVLFLASWAGGVWMTWMLAPGWALYWAPYLLAGLTAAFLVTAAAWMPSMRRSIETASRGTHERAQRMTAAEASLWILIAVLAAPILLRYAG